MSEYNLFAKQVGIKLKTVIVARKALAFDWPTKITDKNWEFTS